MESGSIYHPCKKGIMFNRLIIFTFAIFILYSKARAQNSSDEVRYYKIRLDTINIDGLVTTPEGRPLQYVNIFSKAPSIHYYKEKAYTWTDSNGRFSLKGALFSDTLTFSSFWRSITIENKGSRFIHIKIAIPGNINKEEPTITARRIKKLPNPKTFTVVDETKFTCGWISVNSEFPGGMEKLLDFLSARITYPAVAIANNREGKVTIGFKIQKDGTLFDFHVINGIGYGCEEAVISALKQSKKWNPAIDNGRPIVTEQSVSFIFKLTE